MGEAIRFAVKSWDVRLDARSVEESNFWLNAELAVEPFPNGPKLHIAGQAMPFAGRVSLQFFRNSANGQLGILQYIRDPAMMMGGVYHAAMFDEIVYRHRHGGTLPTALMVEVEVRKLDAQTLVWDVDRSTDLVMSWVNLKFDKRVV